MSGLELALVNLASWSLQVAVLALAAAVSERLLPIRRPAARLAFSRGLLVLALALPLIQPWPKLAPTRAAPVETAVSAALPARGGALGGVADLAVAWPVAVVALLSTGVLVRLTLSGYGLLRLRALRRQALPYQPPPWLAALRDQLSPRAAFRLTNDTAGPATFGIRDPTILLPACFPALLRQRQTQLALHELLHARRRDWAAQLAEELLKALLFFHPGVHWLVARVRLAREQLVDAAVVASLGDRAGYLESLIEMARFASGTRAFPAARFLRPSHLRERVDLLLEEVSMSRIRTLAHTTLAVAAILSAVAVTAAALPLHADSAPSQAPAARIQATDQPAPPAQPKLLRKVDPTYPKEARDAGVQGIFVMDVLIAEDGSIKDARLLASSPDTDKAPDFRPHEVGTLTGDTRLATAALDAVRQWRYEPVLRDGQPIEVRIAVTVAFKLSR